jgi:hypothetical protein
MTARSPVAPARVVAEREALLLAARVRAPELLDRRGEWRFTVTQDLPASGAVKVVVILSEKASTRHRKLVR